MSYCRWSSDDGQCEAYVYEHVAGGFMIHLANTRPVLTEPLPDPVPFEASRLGEWIARRKVVMAMNRAAERKPIGLPHDGETFCEDTAGECAGRLEQLKALGYNVPQYAIDALREEAAEA